MSTLRGVQELHQHCSVASVEAHTVRGSSARAVNSTLPPSWLPDAEWADSLEESLLTAGFPVNVVTLGMWLAPTTAANGVTQLLVQLPVEAPVTTAVEAVVQVCADARLSLRPATQMLVLSLFSTQGSRQASAAKCVQKGMRPDEGPCQYRLVPGELRASQSGCIADALPMSHLPQRSSPARCWSRSTATCRRWS